MAIYDFFLSRNGAASTPANYVGHAGRLFYESTTGEIRISDGTTAGGLPIPITLATETTSGGVKLGPGVTTNAQGQIIIDSEGLDFNFGNFEAITGFYSDSTAYALLSSTHVDEDIVIASNGTGDIKVVGGFEVFATNGTVTASLEDAEPFFKVKEDGQVRILVPLADSTEGGMEIIGSELGTALAPGQAGTMLHLTGNADLPTRVYHDTLGDYGSYVFRRYNGSVVTPTQVLANEDIARFNWTAANNAGMPNQATAQIRVTALENQTTTAQGSKIVFTVTPVGSPTSARVDVATISTADGVSATKFTGPLTGNVTGNVSGTAPAGSLTGNTLASNVVTSSLTTVGTLTNLSVTNKITGSISGNADGSAGSVAAANITGTTLASNVVTSSLTTVGTLTNLAIATGGTITTPRVVINDGGIRTISGGTTCTIDFATDSIILWTAPTGTAVITLSNYTAGARVKLIIALTTTRDITFGVAGVAYSSTGSDNWNGAGGGAVDISNTAVHLDYTCITALATGCYVAVTAN